LVEKKILDALVHGTEVVGERAILLAAEREKMPDEWREAVAAGGERDTGLADFGELEVEISGELAVVICVGVGGGGREIGGRHSAAEFGWVEPVAQQKPRHQVDAIIERDPNSAAELENAGCFQRSVS
jgi:hypothetical protein